MKREQWLSNQKQRKTRNDMKQEVKEYQSEDNNVILSAEIIYIHFSLLVSSVADGLHFPL